MRMKACWFILVLALLTALSASAEEVSALSYNSQGETVLLLQQRLTELGYYTFRITGIYQENTQKAVRDFQWDNGFEPTGIADAALQQLIFSGAAMPKPTPTPAPTPEPIDLQVPYPGQVKYGNSGDNVRRIQTRLAQLGFYTMKISGNYQDNTLKAVRDFQRQNGLAADGVVGEATWQALFFDDTAVDVYATPKPTPAPTPVPYRLTVDVTNQVTTAYGLDENSEYTRVVRRMLCSTGTQSDPTPIATFTLNGATARWCYFPKWGTHAQYWTRIDAANAFHSVIYAEPNEMALKTGSYTGLGKPASHGCIRLMVEDAKWIYQNCGKGTVVDIFEGKKDEELTKSLKIPPLDYNVMLPVPTAGPTPPPVYDPNELPPMPFTTLERGVESMAVFWLQSKLAEMGYYQGTITGGYYAGTAEAVKAFQRDNGLSVDGKAGRQTQTKLYEALLATPSPSPTLMVSTTPTPTVQPSPTMPPRNRP